MNIRDVVRNLKLNPYETLNTYTPFTLTEGTYWSRKTYEKNIFAYLMDNRFINGRKSLYFGVGNTIKPNGFDNRVIHRQAIKAYYTSMQDDSGVNIRNQNYDKIQMRNGGPWLWLTDDLSGCTVFIVEYSDGSYGMIHLRPKDLTLTNYQKYFKYRSWNFTLDDLAELKEKNIALEKEALEVIKSKSSGAGIRRYILVQSELNFSEFSQLNITGIYTNNNWRFFAHNVSPMTEEYDIRELRWRNYPFFSSLVSEYS